LPLLVAAVSPLDWGMPAVTVGTLAILTVVGGLAARADGATALRGAARVAFWSALAMAVTAAIGRLTGTFA